MSLEIFIRAGALAQAEDCLRKGANVNGRGTNGLTPLMVASGRGFLRIVELLLAAGADPNMVEPRMGMTALHLAAQSGNPQIIGLLLDSGAFIDCQSPVLGNTPLIDAILYKQDAAVDMLLRRGARTTIRNHWQQSAADIARQEGLAAVVGKIAERESADAEHIHSLALFRAVEAGDLAEAERLLDAGADPNERTPVTGIETDDYTPLGIATRAGRADIITLLLRKGADPMLAFGLMHGTALHEASYFGNAPALRALLEFGERDDVPPLDLDPQGAYNGYTPLHDAVWHDHLEAAKMLVEAGAALHLASHAGHTPMELAILHGYDEMAEMLRTAERSRRI
jgi:ankyrin repeat protein